MLERFINPAIGEVTAIKKRPNGFVKYKISYICNGKIYHSWSSWIKYDGYEVGDSISLKMLHFPSKCAIIRTPIDVNNNPQQHPVANGLLIGTCCTVIGVAGFLLGRLSKNKS